MDRTEEDMKFVGFFGIFKQSFNTIFSCKKLFTQITLISILHLTLIYLAEIDISSHLFSKLESPSLLESNTYRHNITITTWLYYLLFQLAYFTLLTIFSLLSTAAVVFTIASVYTNRDVVFMHVVKSVPKIWKKTFVTFVFIYLALFIYSVIYNVMVVISYRFTFGYSIFGSVLTTIILMLYILGFLYLTIVWQLASVVTVLENVYGIKAMKKGKNLLNGKKKVGMTIAFVLYGFLLGLVTCYGWFVEDANLFDLAMIWRVMIGILIGVFVMILFLLMITTQTVLYLVCKSYHGEAIDKLSLSTFLGAYVTETVVYPKPGDEIQLGRARAQTQEV